MLSIIEETIVEGGTLRQRIRISLQQADPHARHQRREPESYGYKIEDEPDRKEAHEIIRTINPP